MEKMQCPNCGSNDVVLVAYPEYKCAYCGTRIVLPQAPTGFVDVVLVQAPQGKDQIKIIGVLRQASDLGLSEAKWAVEHMPWVICQNLPVAEGERIRAAIEKAGGLATLKPA
jgi:ribosomal protein L7/L12